MTKPHSLIRLLQHSLNRAFSFASAKPDVEGRAVCRTLENHSINNPFPNADLEYRNPRDVKRPPMSQACRTAGKINPFPNVTS
jgi:hypothetical protein